MKDVDYNSYKFFPALILVGLLSPFSFIFAQDGSSGLPSDVPAPALSEAKTTSSAPAVPSTSSAVESQAALPAGSAPRATVPSAVPASPAVNIAPVSSTVTTTPSSAETTEDTSTNPVLWVMLGALALIPFGYVAVRSLQNKKTEEEKKEGQCFDIKKLMNEKLEKLTNLKGMVEGKVQDKAKEKIREAVKETSAGKLLALVEGAEKEYGRLKKLYEKCMADLETSKRVFIVHGWDGRPNEAWFPWLKKELEAKGYEVVIPSMPHPENPTIDDWVNYLSKVVGKPDKNTFFVGHSIGCQTILRYAERLDKPLGWAVFVAGWFNLENLETDEEKDIAKPWITTPIDFAKVGEVLPKSVSILSDNDPYDAFEENKQKFYELGSKIVILPGAEHINEESGHVALPEALTEFENL